MSIPAIIHRFSVPVVSVSDALAWQTPKYAQLERELSLGPEIFLILTSPWRSRVWTLQEALLAARPIVCCGQQTIPLQNLALTCRFLSESLWWASCIGAGFFDMHSRWPDLFVLWELLHVSTSSSSPKLLDYHGFLAKAMPFKNVAFCLLSLSLFAVNRASVGYGLIVFMCFSFVIARF